MPSRRTRPARPRRVRPGRAPGAWGPAALLVVVLIAGTSAGALPSAPYSAASTGGVEVTFPTAYPRVELSELGNASVGSNLSLEQVLEVAQAPSGPVVVAVAVPTQVTGSAGPVNGSGGGLPLELSAVLTSYPSDAVLWAGPGNLVQPNGAPVGTAHLWINYSAVPAGSGGSGVEANWTIVGWPWANASDLLGVQLAVQTPDASGSVGCTGASGAARSSGCLGVSSFPGTDSFTPGVIGLQQTVDGGPTAAVTWGPASGGAGAGATESIGIFAPSTDLAQLVLAAPLQGAATASGSVAFAILPPALASIGPSVVRGELPEYVAGATVAGALGLFGLLVARRARARAVEEL